MFKLYVIETTINGEKKQRLTTDYTVESYAVDELVRVIGYRGVTVATKQPGESELTVTES